MILVVDPHLNLYKAEFRVKVKNEASIQGNHHSAVGSNRRYCGRQNSGLLLGLEMSFNCATKQHIQTFMYSYLVGQYHSKKDHGHQANRCPQRETGEKQVMYVKGGKVGKWEK
jgi:hypothetical protein